jgi:hypothetical protein
MKKWKGEEVVVLCPDAKIVKEPLYHSEVHEVVEGK